MLKHFSAKSALVCTVRFLDANNKMQFDGVTIIIERKAKFKGGFTLSKAL